ncbi:hypothetical protein [Stappia sp.]|uniref:hypothetical protein n=1 Tax=Stappia sp. TaxID=1870903 RepID=UPI0032D99114
MSAHSEILPIAETGDTAPGSTGPGSPDRGGEASGGLILPAVLFFAIAMAATLGLWWLYGERLFVDRLLTGLANCF